MSKKHRRLNKELANTYIDEEVDELEGEEKYGHEDSI
tara:strand:- start:1674 stop:1784 length:111 start_codon:yes stop_codon:yes gene_type:complete